jgi:hypothetical protein
MHYIEIPSLILAQNSCIVFYVDLSFIGLVLRCKRHLTGTIRSNDVK